MDLIDIYLSLNNYENIEKETFQDKKLLLKLCRAIIRYSRILAGL